MLSNCFCQHFIKHFRTLQTVADAVFEPRVCDCRNKPVKRMSYYMCDSVASCSRFCLLW